MTFDDYGKKYFFDLAIGEAKCKGIKAALDEALQKQDIDNALKLYYEFIEEDQLNLDAYESLIRFPEYLALFEKHPEFQKDNSEDLMRAYKLITGCIQDFYEIPNSQIKNVFSQYNVYCDKFRYNKRSYYRHLWNYMYSHGIDSFEGVGDIFECHKKMMLIPVDKLSEIPAGECDDLTKYILFVEKDIEKALKTAEPIFSGKLYCPQVPLYTYVNFAKYYFDAGELKNAKNYLDRAYHIMHRDFGDSNTLTFDKGLCILMYAYTDTKKALQIFRKQLNVCSENKCGFDNFYLFLSGVHTFRQLKLLGYEKIHFRLPDRSAEIYSENGIYDVEELENYFYSKAEYIADRFDQRNNNSHFTDILNKQYDFNDDYSFDEDIPDMPILQYINENILDGELPVDFCLPAPEKNPDGEPYADGEQDSVAMFFGNVQKEYSDKLEKLIENAILSDDPEFPIEDFDELFSKEKLRTLSIIDKTQDFITANKDRLPSYLVYRLGEALAFLSNNREAVKLGLGILEIFSGHDEETIDSVMELGLCNEFTVFAIWALKSEKNINDLVFELAKKAKGWGRIHAMRFIKPETDEIKIWILNEGIYNTVYNGYSPIDCFEKSGTMQLLKDGLTDDNFSAVAVIMLFLIVDGPTIGIHAFENEKEIISLFIDSAENCQLTEQDENILSVIGANYDDESIKQRIINMGIDIKTPDNETE